MDAAFDNGHHEGGRRGTGGRRRGEYQTLAIIRDKGSDEQHGEDVEDHDPPKCQFNCSRYHFSRVLGFADCDSDQLRPERSENRHLLGRFDTHPKYANVAVTNVLHRPMKRPASPAVQCLVEEQDNARHVTWKYVLLYTVFIAPGCFQ